MDFEVSCAGLSKAAAPDPCIVVIFGMTGDLARHDLIPALYALDGLELLPDRFAVIGFARRDWNDQQLREEMGKYVHKEKADDDSRWQEFARKMFYVQGDFIEAAGDAYGDLKKRTKELQKELHIADNILYHLSTPPSFYAQIMEKLNRADLLRSNNGWRRVIIEKPFGADEASARELDRNLLNIIDEQQLYRVDHFLGKETVQNMMVFRFANPSFEPIWNHHYIDHVQITAAEAHGIGTRGNFYEKTGVVRDMMQNHLLQLLCMTAMEPPIFYEGNALRDETIKVLRSIRPIEVEKDCVLGQYGAGEINGEEVLAYRDEENVAEDSIIPTFAALCLHLDNWRWAGVPFYLRTGKRLHHKMTTISIHFKPTPHLMFPFPDADRLQHSVLTFRLQPEEGIQHTFLAKQPGPDICLRPVTMNFLYDRAFGIDKMPGAYQWLMLDAMHGDQTLFPRSDWIYAAWSIVDPIVAHSEKQPPAPLPNYAAGSWGPKAAEHLMGEDGREWHVT